MSLTDFFIIYFACGSPFGVYEASKLHGRLSIYGFGMVAGAFLLWPAFAISLIRRRYFIYQDSRDAPRQAQIERIRAGIESLAFPEGATVRLFEFRDTIARFANLIEEVNHSRPAKPANELFEISGHPNVALAAICLRRLNSKQLLFHKLRVRREFVDLVSQMALDTSIPYEIFALATELAEQIGDTVATNDLELRRSEVSIPAERKPTDLGKSSKPLTRSATV